MFSGGIVKPSSSVKLKRDKMPEHCVYCGSKSIESQGQVVKKRPNGEKMEQFICLNCDVEWVE